MILDRKVETILEKNGYDCCWWHGCFDVAARKDEFMLLKVLDNVDSFQEDQARNLRILSEKLDASVSVIGNHTRHEILDNNVIYERFSIPTFTPDTLDNILHSNYPMLFRTKGGMFREIDPQALRSGREAMGLTQSELASSVGITKKSVYEHETKRMMARADTVSKLENTLKKKISIPYSEFKRQADVEEEAQNEFEKNVSEELKRKGFEINFVRKSPFNLIAEERFMVLSEIESRQAKIKERLEALKEFSDVSGRSIIAVTENEVSSDIPIIERKKLKDLKAKDIKKLAMK